MLLKDLNFRLLPVWCYYKSFLNLCRRAFCFRWLHLFNMPKFKMWFIFSLLQFKAFGSTQGLQSQYLFCSCHQIQIWSPLKKRKRKKKDFGVERFDFNEKIQLKIIEPHALLPVKARYLFSTLARGRTIRPFLAICSHFYVLSAPSGTVCLFCSPIEWGHFGLLHLILQGNDRRNSFWVLVSMSAFVCAHWRLTLSVVGSLGCWNYMFEYYN